MIRAIGIALALTLAVGMSVTAQPDDNGANCQPVGSSIASVVLPGAGQWLNGQAELAQFQFGVGVVNAGLAALFWEEYGLVAVPVHLIWAGYSAVDAAINCLQARQIDRAEAVAN